MINRVWRENPAGRIRLRFKGGKVRYNLIVSAIAAGSLLAAPTTAQELTGTLKKIKDSGAITLGHRESSVPFSYYDDKQQVIGYSIDLCYRIVDAVKKELKLDELAVKLDPVTSSTRIPLMANGTIDLECGSTTNDLDRQKQVAFAVTDYITAVKFVSKKAANFKTVDDLKGKTVVSTSGTLNIKVITELNAKRNLNLNIIAVQDHAEAFLMVETDRAAAFVMDDILLYGFVAGAKAPGDYVVSADPLLIEPYAIMLRRDDPAFKKVADNTLIGLFKSGEIHALYAKWFTQPVPPKGINLNVPMSDTLKRVIANPTDSGNPTSY